MQQLDHETSKTFKGARNAHGRADLNKHSFGGVDVNLKLSSLIDRGVQKSKEALGPT